MLQQTARSEPILMLEANVWHEDGWDKWMLEQHESLVCMTAGCMYMNISWIMAL